MRYLSIIFAILTFFGPAAAFWGECSSNDASWCWMPWSSSGDKIYALQVSDTKVTITLNYVKEKVYEIHEVGSTDPTVNSYEKHSSAAFKSLISTLSLCAALGTPVAFHGYWRNDTRFIVTEVKILPI